MTTFTIVSNFEDFQIVEIQDPNWTNARQGAGASETVTKTGSALSIRRDLSGGNYRSSQAFISFDTTGLPDGPAQLPLKLEALLNPIGGATTIEASEANPTTGATSDYKAGSVLPSSPDWGEATTAVEANPANALIEFTGPYDVTRDDRYTVFFWNKGVRTNTTPTGSNITLFFPHQQSNVNLERFPPTLTYVQLPAASLSATLDDMSAAGAFKTNPKATLAATLDGVTAAAASQFGARGKSDVTLDGITGDLTASSLVKNNTPFDRSLAFVQNTLAERSLVLE